MSCPIDKYAYNCRICLKQDDTMADIISIGLHKKLLRVLNIKVSSDDKLPKGICNSCYKKLEDFIRLKSLARDSDNYLKGLLRGEINQRKLEEDKKNWKSGNVNENLNDKIHLIVVPDNCMSENDIEIKDVNNDNVGLMEFCKSVIEAKVNDGFKESGFEVHENKGIYGVNLFIYQCSECRLSFESKEYWMEHTKSSHNNLASVYMSKYKCPICFVNDDDKGEFLRHLSMHKEEGFLFLKCGSDLEMDNEKDGIFVKQKLINNLEVGFKIFKIATDFYKCTFCNSVEMTSSMKDHLEECYSGYSEDLHGPPRVKYTCPVCRCKWVDDLDGYYSHLSSHRSDDVVFVMVDVSGNPVEIDHPAFVTMEEALDMLPLKNDDKKVVKTRGWLTCPSCDFESGSLSALTEHCTKQHGSGTPSCVYSCPACYDVFQFTDTKQKMKILSHLKCHKDDGVCFLKVDANGRFVSGGDNLFDLFSDVKDLLNGEIDCPEKEFIVDTFLPDVFVVSDCMRDKCRRNCSRTHLKKWKSVCGDGLSRRHKKNHTKRKKLDGAFKCHICQRDFQTESALKKHVSAHLDPNYSECDKCKLPISTLACLERHKRTHKDASNKFACKVCHSRFSTTDELDCHKMEMNHLKLRKRFECNVCHESFVVGSEFRQHTKQHPNYKTSECKLCGKRLSTTQSLTLHLGKHFESNGILCHYCGKLFFERRNYERHLLTHTGVKPFVCDMKNCTKSFYTHHELNRHKKYHNNTRDYKCPHCPKSFHEASHLRVHTRTHTGEKPYQCPHCKKSFATRTRCKKHIRQIHQGVDCDMIQTSIYKKVPVFEAV